MMSDARWVAVSPSAFEHEEQGLALIRAVTPDESPYRAWANCEFRDARGAWHEVDLILLTRSTLYLVELKHYFGVVRGSDRVWERIVDGRPPRREDSPLLLTRRKAQYFASKLKAAAEQWADERGASRDEVRAIVPFVKEAVFLHHAQFQCQLPEESRRDLYGLDGAQELSGLPGISELVFAPPHREPITEIRELLLVDLLKRIGLVARREREIGSWRIEENPIAAGPDWQDWAAQHIHTGERARVRFPIVDPSASDAVRAEQARVVRHEFAMLQRLSHDGIVRPRDYVSGEMGDGIAYVDEDGSERLDLWWEGNRARVSLATQLSIIRQIAEALHYAHGNRVVHRALNPSAVWVRDRADGGAPTVKVGGWQAAGGTTPGAGTSLAGITSLHHATVPSPTADDGSLDDVFAAPEGAWSPTADRVRLDVFGLGALTYYLVAGKPPATSAVALKARLVQQGGLDVAVDVPQVSAELRDLVLKATSPRSSERFGDVGSFLAALAAAESAANEPDEAADPLDASPGDQLDGRFRLVRRLGQGSTAVGLLVHDEAAGTERVLKVALNTEAGARLGDEAAVLANLSSPRIVRLVEGPILIGGRPALVLDEAGRETLTDELRELGRLPIDRLQTYGTDLMDALVVLDAKGVDHRDIKPSNLGVQEGRGDRKRHLVLFDFSLTNAAASAVGAGTPPYLDPFFDEQRKSFDSAAERYSAAVVLFEMATGETPRYGDGTDDPGAISDDVTLERHMFDPALADGLLAFFAKALARSPRQRHETAKAMREAWVRLFTGAATTTQPDEESDRLAAAATLTTPLAASGLTARALSGLEPLRVATVGELLAVDPVAIQRLRGWSAVTRDQVWARLKQWRATLDAPAQVRCSDAASLTDVAQALLDAVGDDGRAGESRRAVLRLVLGLSGDVDAFATQSALAASLAEPLTPGRVAQIFGELQEAWAKNPAALGVLTALVETTVTALADLGGVASPNELAQALRRAYPEADGADQRRALGLVRLAVDRHRVLGRAENDEAIMEMRRRGGVVTLIAIDTALFDVAESLGAHADTLIAALGDPTRELVPAARVSQRLTRIIDSVRGKQSGDADDEDADDDRSILGKQADPTRLAPLAAAASGAAHASALGELYTDEFTRASALAVTLAGFGGRNTLSPAEVRARVAARFPSLQKLPERPRLDALVEEAGLGLVFDNEMRRYRLRGVASNTTGLESRRPTSHDVASSPVSITGRFGVRLDDSVSSRSFLALGVRSERLVEAVETLRRAYDAEVVDLSELLVDALKQQTVGGRLTWDHVRAADAAAPHTKAAQGLGQLVRRAWPQIENHLVERMDAAHDVATTGTSGSKASEDAHVATPLAERPLLLTDAAPLARYGHMDMLARWSDLAAPRSRPVWLLVPQVSGNHGAVLDGAPLPLAAPSQFVPLDSDWIDTHAAALAAGKEH